MKTAVLDIGNTRTKAAVFGDDGIERKIIFPTSPNFQHPEAKDFFSGVDRVVVGSVVPEATLPWKNFFPSLVEITAKAPWGFSFGVEQPESVGVDRLANMEAVCARGEPMVVVDAGTATKWDLLSFSDGKACFEGGAIAPGVRLSAEALLEKGARLPSQDLIEELFQSSESIAVVGKNTKDALRAGIVKAFVVQVDGMLAHLFAQNHSLDFCRVVATGGNSFLLKNRTRLINEFREDLTIEGLYAVAQKL